MGANSDDRPEILALCILCAELSFFMEENTYITLERHDKDDLFYMWILYVDIQENLFIV
jgi:hypothetical protein